MRYEISHRYVTLCMLLTKLLCRSRYGCVSAGINARGASATVRFQLCHFRHLNVLRDEIDVLDHD